MTIETAAMCNIFEQVEATSVDAREAVKEAMGYLAYGQGPAKYPIATETMDRAVAKACVFLKRVCELHAAVDRVKAIEDRKGLSERSGPIRRFVA
jgi:hypothetical protein